jgi:hypothetical protein
MKLRIPIALLMIMMCAPMVTAQKIKMTNGKISDLKGTEKIRIEYDYSDLGVGKFENEEEYVAEKVAEKNDDEAGSGDQWREAWYNDRPTRYEPKFEELLSKNTTSFECGQDVDSDVIMQVHTTFIEPGFNVGVARKPASINLEVRFIQGNKLLSSMLVLNSPGSGAMGYDFDAGYRIAEAYAKAGKSLGRYLEKQMK